jgi:hypothetical protein
VRGGEAERRRRTEEKNNGVKTLNPVYTKPACHLLGMGVGPGQRGKRNETSGNMLKLGDGSKEFIVLIFSICVRVYNFCNEKISKSHKVQ